MTILYTIDNKLIFDEPLLTLKEAVERHKKNLQGANLQGAKINIISKILIKISNLLF